MANSKHANALNLLENSVLQPTRRERRKQEMRSRILEAANDLFPIYGFQETRVDDICERADVAHKTFFNHFPTKLDLLREIARMGIEQLMFDVEKIRKAESRTPERIHQFFDTMTAHILDSGSKNRELLVELVHLVSGDATERSEQGRRLSTAFSGFVEDGLAQGDVTRRHDPQTLTEMILGACYVLIFSYANLDDFPVRERGRAAARLLVDMLAPHPEETHGTT
jgi:AcrR family transcriptional regulator